MITQQRLKELLHYDPATGRWTWLVRRGPAALAGSDAGTILKTKRSKPTRRIHVDGKKYQASRLAWLYMTGRWPVAEIDHEDRDTLNDRWSNLRDVSRFQNEINKGAYQNNQSGFKGVTTDARTGRHRAFIQRNWKRVYLGEFTSATAAAEAYRAADREAA